MSGRNARLVRIVARRANQAAAEPRPVRFFKRWFKSLAQADKAASRHAVRRVEGPHTEAGRRFMAALGYMEHGDAG